MFDEVVNNDKHIQIFMSLPQIILENPNSFNTEVKNLLKSLKIKSKIWKLS